MSVFCNQNKLLLLKLRDVFSEGSDRKFWRKGTEEKKCGEIRIQIRIEKSRKVLPNIEENLLNRMLEYLFKLSKTQC